MKNEMPEGRYHEKAQKTEKAVKNCARGSSVYDSIYCNDCYICGVGIAGKLQKLPANRC